MVLLMEKVLSPKIDMFSPFAKPFESEKEEIPYVTLVIVAPEIEKYMQDDNNKIVAKCTPCQCCACR